MTKRARYDGPHEELYVDLSEGDLTRAHEHVIVQRGHLLPDDVPARIRDELLSRPDWSEVKQADQSKSDKER